MKDLKQFAAVKEASEGGSKLQEGGYVLSIHSVKDVEDKEYLIVQYDIAEGENAGYFAELEEKFDFWGLSNVHSYKEAAVPFFKRFCSSVNASNPGFSFNPFGGNADEQTLVGKKVGAVLVEKEYDKNNGEKGTKMVVSYFCDDQKIRSGNFKMPKKKEAPKAQADTSWTNVSADTAGEVPFN